MKQELYFIFYKKIHNKMICVLLSTLAYTFLCVRYFFKKLFITKRTVNMEVEKARKIITNLYPKIDDKAEIINLPMNNEIDLSIVMPVYNYDNLIENAINSILEQRTSYKFELIIVDDGSLEPTKRILEKYNNKNNVKIIHQENGGIGAARNTGINNAVGKYIMFVDCDDIVHNDIVESLMSIAYKNNRDIVSCAHNLFKENNGEVLSVKPYIYPETFLKYDKNEDTIKCFGAPWCKVFKREMFEKVRFFPGYWYEDTIVTFFLFRLCQSFEYIPEVKYEYRWYEKNFSHIQNKESGRVVQRYWMLERCAEETANIGLDTGVQFYKLLLKHCGCFYLKSFDNLEQDAIDALFVLAAELLKKYKPTTKYHLTYELKELENSILKNDINLWKLVSKCL